MHLIDGPQMTRMPVTGIVRFSLLFLLFWIMLTPIAGQNLVPNPSFEHLRNLPVKPNPKKNFEYELKSGYLPYLGNLMHWFAATESTPDLRISDREGLKECIRRYQTCDQARTGNNCAGIMTHMPQGKPSSYREYIQVKLHQPLRPGVLTYVELWVSKERQAKLISNNLGCHFSMGKINVPTKSFLPLKPQLNCDTFINQYLKQWVKLEWTFTPDTSYHFVQIGNFKDDAQTMTQAFKDYTGSSYTPPYAYYLIDDVRIWQEGDSEILRFADQEVKEDQPVTLDHIEFETDRSTLLEASIQQLDQLVIFLADHPSVQIQIHGHTDDQGSAAYNQALSESRAQAVGAFLIENGIEATRIQTAGYGETRPIQPNDSEDGRRRNRRVEFIPSRHPE